MPFLVTLTERDGGYVAGRLLRASDLGVGGGGEHGDWRPVVMDGVTGAPAAPNGSIGDRWGKEGDGRWNLDLGDTEPELSLLGTHDELQEKVRTITGFSTIAFALDWNRPPRQQAATAFWYLATDQWRYDALAGDDFCASGRCASRGPRPRAGAGTRSDIHLGTRRRAPRDAAAGAPQGPLDRRLGA